MEADKLSCADCPLKEKTKSESSALELELISPTPQPQEVFSLTPRFQVPLTQNQYYKYFNPKPKYLIIGYLDPKRQTLNPISPLKGLNNWVHGPFGQHGVEVA